MQRAIYTVHAIQDTKVIRTLQIVDRQ